jgi:hypothetical protein
MLLDIGMPHTIHSDIMNLVLVVIVQIKIYKILYGSSLYGRNW